MNKKVLAAGLAAVMAAGLMAGCSGQETTEEATDTLGVNVTVEKVSERSIEATATYTGEIITDDFAYVTSKVSAKVNAIYAELGDMVKAGDVLAVLDSTDYSYQLEQAEAAIKQAEAAYNSALTSLNNVGGVNEQTKVQLEQAMNAATIAYNDAKTNFDRQTQLYEMGAISLASYESAKSAYENASLAYESAKKNYEIGINVITPGNESSAKSGVETALAAKEAALLAARQARENIAATRITAPISGYVSAKNIAMGQFASPGVALFTISNTDNLQVEIRVTESVVPYVKEGGKAIVSISAAGLENIEGTVSVVNPVKDQMTGMYTVRVGMPRTEGLKVGMFADVTLITEQSREDAVCVLATSVMQEGRGYYVYVVTDNVAHRRDVTIGVSDGEYTQIIEGVAVGEAVVDEGKEYISEKNNLVNVVE